MKKETDLINMCEARSHRRLVNLDYKRDGEEPLWDVYSSYRFQCHADDPELCKTCKFYANASEADEWCKHLYDENGEFGDLCENKEAQADALSN